MLTLLEDALRRKRSACMLGTGAMTDPYIPLESELGYVRGALARAPVRLWLHAANKIRPRAARY